MQTIQFRHPGPPNVLELAEVDAPSAADGQVLIEVEYAGVNFADTMLRAGGYFAPLSLPAVLGSEVAGRIAAVGEGVGAPAVGTRVIALMPTAGGYAERVVVPAEYAVPVPDGVSLNVATALLIQGLTAYSLLHDAARVTAGQWVLVQAAAGGVGQLAVQLAKLAGAQVVGAASGAKLEAVRSLGADVVVDYRTPNWTDEVRAATQGHGVDVVLEAVGGRVAQQSLELLARGGQVVLYGLASGEGVNYSSIDLMMRAATVQTFSVERGLDPARMVKTLEQLLSLLNEGKLHVEVQTFPFTQASDAHRAIEQGQTQGKVVLRF